jgi:hypothetical protein
MALIQKTIGIGGDFLTFEAAYAFLCGLGAWTNDYYFNLISTIIINAWPDISLPANRVNQNGHFVIFDCTYNSARPKSPLEWHQVKFSGASGYLWYTHDTGSDELNDVVIITNSFFEQITADDLILLRIRCWSSIEGNNHTLENIYFKGYAFNVSTAYDVVNNHDYITIKNLLIWNIKNGLHLQPAGFIGGDNFPGRKNYTDISIYNFNGDGIDVADIPGNNSTFKNCFAFKASGVGSDWEQTNFGGAPPIDNIQVNNCADSDNSIVTNLTSNTIITKCVPNVVALDNLQSVDSNDLGKGFLDLILGDHTINIIGTEIFTGGSPDLGKTGTDSGLTKDIAGRDIPGKDGGYSIGAYEQQYIFTSTFLFPLSDRVSDGKGRDIALYLGTHDLVFVNYDLVLISGLSYLAQKLKIKLLFFFKEWFLDTTKGMDFYGTLFVKNPNLNAVDNMIKITIVDTEGVLELLEYNADYSFSDRKLNVTFKVNTIYGELTFKESLKP